MNMDESKTSTEQALEKELERLTMENEKLEAENVLLRNVGKITAHDIRGNFQNIRNSSFVIAKETDDPTIGEYLDIINTAVKNADHVTEFIYNYAKVGGKEFVYVDAGRTFEEVARRYLNLSRAEIVNDCHNLEVLADSFLSRAFENLIINSDKHSGEDLTKIHFYCEDKGDQIRLVYEDDGVGIADEDKEAIFDEGYNGTGLGLHLIRSVCTVYGWDIKEVGIYGEGAKFVFTLPIKSVRYTDSAE